MIDIAISSDRNVRRKEYESLEKYQGLKGKLEMWKVKAKIIPLVIGSHGTVAPKLE